VKDAVEEEDGEEEEDERKRIQYENVCNNNTNPT